MKVGANNYELRVGIRTLRILKNEFNKEIESLKFGVLEFVELTYCSLKAYTDFDGTLNDVEDALDNDMTAYVEARDAIAAFFGKVGEAMSEAKN